MKKLLDLFQLSGCFARLPREEMEYLDKHKTQVNYLKGEVIFKQGAFAPHVLFINSGYAISYLQINTNKRINIQILMQGDLMAFSSLFDNDTYLYSAIALSDVTLCMIEKDALSKILLRNPDVALQIMKRTSLEESRYLNIINNISYKQMRGKLAAAILYLNEKRFMQNEIQNLISRKIVADFAGITVESTVKFLKEFENDKLIELKGKEIIIKNRESIELISKVG